MGTGRWDVREGKKRWMGRWSDGRERRENRRGIRVAPIGREATGKTEMGGRDMERVG